jgi:hypothetical protein
MGEVRYKGRRCINPPIWRTNEKSMNSAIRKRPILPTYITPDRFILDIYASVHTMMIGI